MSSHSKRRPSSTPPPPRRKKKKYKEAWTIFGPIKIYPPTVLCPGIVREGNRAIPVQHFYKNAKSKESEG